MSELMTVARTDAIPPGRMKAFEVDGRRIVMANVSDEFLPFGANCPHEAAPLDQGTLFSDQVDCPRHHYI